MLLWRGWHDKNNHAVVAAGHIDEMHNHLSLADRTRQSIKQMGVPSNIPGEEEAGEVLDAALPVADGLLPAMPPAPAVPGLLLELPAAPAMPAVPAVPAAAGLLLALPAVPAVAELLPAAAGLLPALPAAGGPLLALPAAPGLLPAAVGLAVKGLTTVDPAGHRQAYANEHKHVWYYIHAWQPGSCC